MLTMAQCIVCIVTTCGSFVTARLAMPWSDCVLLAARGVHVCDMKQIRRVRRITWRRTKRSCSGVGWWTWRRLSHRRSWRSERRSNDCVCAPSQPSSNRLTAHDHNVDRDPWPVNLVFVRCVCETLSRFHSQTIHPVLQFFMFNSFYFNVVTILMLKFLNCLKQMYFSLLLCSLLLQLHYTCISIVVTLLSSRYCLSTRAFTKVSWDFDTKLQICDALWHSWLWW